MSGSSGWWLSRSRAWIAVGLAVIGVLLLWSGLTRPSTPDGALAGAPNGHSTPPPAPSVAEPTSPRPTARTGPPNLRDRVTGLVLPESDPVAVSIPRIGVRSTLVDLGLDRDGAMEVPRDPALAGWFTRGPAPGALGPAVIAGHVTWDGAPAVFHRLSTLRRGDHVSVTRKDGKTAVFTCQPGGQILEGPVPESGGLRRDRPRGAAPDHLWWYL